MNKHDAAKVLGASGGASQSPAKREASRENGKEGGRPSGYAHKRIDAPSRATRRR